jgi:hypothetical protein
MAYIATRLERHTFHYTEQKDKPLTAQIQHFINPKAPGLPEIVDVPHVKSLIMTMYTLLISYRCAMYSYP